MSCWAMEGEGYLRVMTSFFIFYRVRKAPLVQLAEMGYRVPWGSLALLDPRAWQERMETRCGDLQTLGQSFQMRSLICARLLPPTPALFSLPTQVLLLISHLPCPCRVRWEIPDRRALKGIRVNM